MEHPSDTAGGAGPSPTILQKLFRDLASRQDAHQKREYVKSWTGGSRTRPYAPHPPRFARHLPLKGKAFGRLIAVLSFRRGRTPAGPQMYAARPGGRALRPSTSCHLLGKARRGCGTAPTTILEQPGPSGPDWTAESHSDFARRKCSYIFQVRVPRNGGSRGWANMDTECPS